MYFWKIEELKSQFRQNEFRDKQIFAYLLLFVTLTGLAMFGLIYTPSASRNVWAYLTDSIYVIAPILGTIVRYRANRGANGTQFADKYFSIGFVLFIRFLPFIAVLMVPSTIYGMSLYSDTDLSPYTLLDVVLNAAWLAAYYWRFAVHLHELAEA